MSTTITFLGAAGTVTGSNHLVEVSGRRVLVDGGLYQGQHGSSATGRERNDSGYRAIA